MAPAGRGPRSPTRRRKAASPGAAGTATPSRPPGRRRAAVREVAIYLYCLVGGPRPSLTRMPPGLPDCGPVRLLPASADDPAGGDLWLVVADAPLERYGEAALAERLQDLERVSEVAMAHEAVVAHFALRQGGGGVLPMKLFTLFLDDRRAVAHVRRRARTLKAILARVAGQLEWGVRIRLVPPSPAPAPAAPPAIGQRGSGTQFLMRKHLAKVELQERWQRARTEAQSAHGELAELATAARLRELAVEGAPVDERHGLRLLVDGVYLVPVGAGAEFRAAVRGLARRLAQAGAELELTGPWPAYHFIEDPTTRTPSNGRVTP